MDDTFQVYINRVARLTLPEAHRSQVQHIQSSPKFQPRPDGGFDPVPFPGYSVITPPWVEDSENGIFYEQLQHLQQQVLDRLPARLLVPVPPESFHVTLADLIWDSAYRHAAAKDPDFEQKLRDRIAAIFQYYQPLVRTSKPALWQVLGLTVRARAVGVCLAPKDETAYQQVLMLRRGIYQDHELIALGIEQQYHLTAHITFGYFGQIDAELDRESIGQTLSDINHEWLEVDAAQSFCVHRAELRKFDDMTHYYREPGWAVLDF